MLHDFKSVQEGLRIPPKLKLDSTVFDSLGSSFTVTESGLIYAQSRLKSIGRKPSGEKENGADCLRDAYSSNYFHLVESVVHTLTSSEGYYDSCIEHNLRKHCYTQLAEFSFK